MRDTKMTAGKKYDEITCPFCFKTFDSETVHFKAMTLKENDTGTLALDDFSETADENFDFFAEAGDKEQDKTEDKSLNQLFQEKEDVLYKNFWKRYANQPEWKYANYPVITDKDSRMMMGGYHHDADGFVDSVTDAFGESTRERICPCCHNPLPPNYGKYPVHFIATVGITSSGKTVYLSQLMKNMDGIMANVGLGTLSMTEGDARFIKEHPVKKDIPLPRGTTPGTLSEPLFYVILSKGTYHTLVFYDVAGENCVDPEGMEKFGPFVEHADGIIMILDPDQFSRVREDTDDDIAGPKAVLKAMFNSFLSSKNQGGKTDVPLALTISKSDKLYNHPLISPNSNLFQEIRFDEKNQGFDSQQYRNVMGEVRKFLRDVNEGRQLTMILESCFEKYGLFAFTALNCDVKEEEVVEDGVRKKVAMPVSHPSPIRIEEPLLWLLNQFGIVRETGSAQGGSGLGAGGGLFSRFFGGKSK